MRAMLPSFDCDAGTLPRLTCLRIGGAGYLGVSLPAVLQLQPRAAGTRPTRDSFFGRANSCILVFLSGGHPQHETFDPKPDAPDETRGPFKPIDTNIPGVSCCRVSRVWRIDCVSCDLLRPMTTRMAAARTTTTPVRITLRTDCRWERPIGLQIVPSTGRQSPPSWAGCARAIRAVLIRHDSGADSE